MTTTGGDRGSAVIETVIVVPAFLLFVLLIVAGGRIMLAQQAVQAAAADAARTASISRTQAAAEHAGRAGAAASLTNQGLRCSSEQVSVDTHGFGSPVGTPAKIVATVTCQVDLFDLTVPGIPGSRRITATMTSPLDTYRER